MATLTATQRTDIQGDLGITADEAVFTNDELQRLFDRAGGDYALAVYYGYRQLLAQANKFHNYTVGQTKIERATMRDNIRDSMAFWKSEAAAANNQAMIVGMKQIPPRDKDRPYA